MRETGDDHVTPVHKNSNAADPGTITRNLAVVPLTSLLPADSPRLEGEDEKHIHLLAKIDVRLPPIVVHRATMRVIDGMHRLRAAALRGDREITVEYFDGDEFEAFVAAVRLNASHGLPLTRADREAAALRIIHSDLSWSNRAISVVTGLSAPTIGKLRQLASDDSGGSVARVGLDGRVRPVNSVEGRRKASALIAERPDASLREIAKGAGISVGTARDVRERMRRGEDPIPSRLTTRRPNTAKEPGSIAVSRKVTPFDSLRTVHALSKDPSIRQNMNGRLLLKLISVSTISSEKRARLVLSVPEHCADKIATLARFCSEWWIQLANEIEQRRHADTAHFTEKSKCL